MQKFKKGDKVVCNSNDAAFLTKDKCYHAMSDTTDDGDVLVMNDRANEFFYHSSYFTLHTPKQTDTNVPDARKKFARLFLAMAENVSKDKESAIEYLKSEGVDYKPGLEACMHVVREQREKAKENLFAGDCIRTVSGIYVNVFEPTPEMICIEDIAHSLSMQCRFGGHLPKFYSVAEHCVRCAWKAPDEDKLSALLHDASEAYLLDIPSPIKRRLANYHEIEDGLMRVIAQKFSITWPLPESVKKCDNKELHYEWDAIMLQDSNKVSNRGWKRQKAKNYFLMLFQLLTQ